MAAVIHTLWERNDTNLLIMPGSVPIDEPAVQFELMRYLDDPGVPVIENDVDGPHSVPLRMDRDNPTLVRYSAARRVARTIFIGSAPKLGGGQPESTIRVSSWDARSREKPSRRLATRYAG